MAMSALLNSNSKPQSQQQQHQSGLSGLASSLIGGSHHNTSSTSQSSGGGSSSLVGQLASSLIGGSHSKPQSQQQGTTSSSSGSGLGGMMGGLLGGQSSVGYHEASNIRERSAKPYQAATTTELRIFLEWKQSRRNIYGASTAIFVSACGISACNAWPVWPFEWSIQPSVRGPASS